MDKRIVATFCAAALGFWVLMLGFGGTLPFARQSGTAANAAALAAMTSAEQESETLPAGIAAQTAAADAAMNERRFCMVVSPGAVACVLNGVGSAPGAQAAVKPPSTGSVMPVT